MGYFTSNQELAFGIDLSRYNTSADGRKKVNFDGIAGHDPQVSFIAMRAGISWAYQDPWFAYYLQEAERVGCLRLPYHVLYPAESALAQMDNFMRILGDADLENLRLVLDLELEHGCSKRRITDTVQACLQVLKRRCGRYPILYSRASWVDVYLNVDDLPDVDWWLAQYRWPRPFPLFTPEYPSPPRLPRGVGSWLIHQSAEKAPAIAAAGCYYMDYNRWNGGRRDVLRYFGQIDEPLQEVICPLDQLVCPVKFKRQSGGSWIYETISKDDHSRQK